jgi:hypothetical protein
VIAELSEAIVSVDAFADIPVLMAKALAGGISLEGAGEALSIGAAGLFLRSLGGNPMDVHLHTSINLRRYLLRLDGISVKNKLMLLLTWQSGPEIRSTAVAWSPTRSPIWRRLPPCPRGRRRSSSTPSSTASTTSRGPIGPRSPISA